MSRETFKVILDPVVQKDLKALKRVQKQVVDAILKLETNPKKGHELKANLQGIRSLEFSIKGSGQYRAAYLLLEKQKTCIVFAVGPHENFYVAVAKKAKLIKPLIDKVREAKKEVFAKPKKSRAIRPKIPPDA
jgi:mRNA-degrading endonuclease RelE of RelBE toxin-antitoxin system